MDLNAILFDLLILVLGIVVMQALVIGGLFLVQSSRNWRANLFFGLLLITFGLTLLHNILQFTGFYEQNEQFYFLPIYFTLAFPVLLFYHVKFNLYPHYRIKWTDSKHFLLPLAQFIFFFSLFFTAVEFKSPLFEREFYNPFYGGLEQALYLVLFFAYIYFSYRYIRRKGREVQNRLERKRVIYLEKLVQVFFLLFCVHTTFVVVDFVSYEFLNVNLRKFKLFTGLGALSFAVLLVWLGVYGFQVLFWGRRIFRLDPGNG